MAYPDFSTGEPLAASDLDAIGLWLVKTQTVGTGVSSITVTNAFTANYDAYQIIACGVSASGTGVASFQLSGLTSGYYGNLIYANNSGGAVASAGYNNASQVTHAGGTNSSILMFDIKVVNPFLAKATYMISTFNEQNNAGPVTAVQNSSTSVTGFTITAGSGTFTGGTIRVYGYRN